MASLVWGESGQRFFETGIDRGVLFPKVGSGVPWDGIISVSESPTGGDPRPYYYDGFKYLNVSAAAEALYVHRNTLRFRLEKIKKILHLDPCRHFQDAVLCQCLLAKLRT